jgi:hypothetical protein
MTADPDRPQALRYLAWIIAPAALLAVGATLLLAGPAEPENRIGELERAQAGVPSRAAEAAQPATFQ